MTHFLRIICCFFFIGLSACVSHNETETKDVTQCLMICAKHLKACNQYCNDDCRNCSAIAHYSAEKHFSKYVKEQQIQGKMIERNLNSYRDPLQCRKVSCSCKADYNTCKQSCTGVVQKRLQPLPYCP